MNIEIRRSNRKTMTLEVTPDAKVIVRAPCRMPEATIRRFINEKSSWIEESLRKVTERQKERGGSGAGGASRQGCPVCRKDRRNLWPDYDPEPEKQMGKLFGKREPEFQLPSYADAGNRPGLCGGA